MICYSLFVLKVYMKCTTYTQYLPKVFVLPCSVETLRCRIYIYIWCCSNVVGIKFDTMAITANVITEVFHAL